MAPKAIRNTTGKPTTVEALDTKLHMRHIRGLEPSADMRKLDRQYEPNKLAQAESESGDNFPSED